MTKGGAIMADTTEAVTVAERRTVGKLVQAAEARLDYINGDLRHHAAKIEELEGRRDELFTLLKTWGEA